MAADISTLGKRAYDILKGHGSIRREESNATTVRDSKRFRGVPIKAVDEVTALIDAETKEYFQDKGAKFTTIDSLKKAAEEAVERSVRTFAKAPKDGSLATKVFDSYWNVGHQIGTDGDPSIYGAGTSPNVWISPYEANSLYSQKGLPELITNKKSKTILLNGMKVKNKMLSPEEIDKISLNMIRLDIPKVTANAVRDSLVFGGDLVFPMLKGDTPVTTLLPLRSLVKLGMLKKGCIDYIISLDRWNVMHLPITNPTQRDFLLPEKYFVPFLGADVHGSRCSRIITSDQAGYFGKVMTLGWGLSDFVGYMRSLLNYKTAVSSIPLMIQQMSLLVRSIPADSALAQEGLNAIDEMIQEDTMRIREISENNPIHMDMVGELQVVNRQFTAVPSLLRLLRQDLAADATIPENLLWSSEKGSFSSGDDTEGNKEKENEAVKYVHKDVESQFRTLANLVIIDALGASERVLSALPYTELHFDVPMVANSKDRATIAKSIAESFFSLVSGQMPVSDAAEIASAFAGDEMSLDSTVLKRLEDRQAESDKRQKEKFDKEMELLDAQIESTKRGAAAGGLKKPDSMKKGKYSRLEQEQHEKTRMPGEKRDERLAKAMGDSFLDRLLKRK